MPPSALMVCEPMVAEASAISRSNERAITQWFLLVVGVTLWLTSTGGVVTATFSVVSSYQPVVWLPPSKLNTMGVPA